MTSSIQVQPQVFMVLCVISWTQSLVYFHKWRPWKANILGFVTLAVFGGVETALILTIRVSSVLFSPAKSSADCETANIPERERDTSISSRYHRGCSAGCGLAPTVRRIVEEERAGYRYQLGSHFSLAAENSACPPPRDLFV